MDNTMDYLAKKLEIESWKKNIAYPLLGKVSKLMGADVKHLLTKVYSRMQADYSFDMTTAQLDFADKYNGLIELNGINVVSSNADYQKLFRQALGDYLRDGLKIVQHQEKLISDLLNKEFRSQEIEKAFAELKENYIKEN